MVSWAIGALILRSDIKLPPAVSAENWYGCKGEDGLAEPEASVCVSLARQGRLRYCAMCH